MKFEFYYKGKKKVTQTLKAKSYDEFNTIAVIAKCEITREKILNDLNDSDRILLCKVGDKSLTMKELWKFVIKKLKNTPYTKDNKKDKKSKDLKKKKKKNKKKEKSKNEVKNGRVDFDSAKPKNTNGLIKMTRR